MLIYVEKKALTYPITQQILAKFSSQNVIEIQHYKNLFDQNMWDYPLLDCIILAKQDNISILDTPPNYGFPGKSFFFKPAINCISHCEYCYLQGTFRNRFPVFFVNYDEMQLAISDKINLLRTSGYDWQITFYASNYADLLATEHLTNFHQHFIPFFEQFDSVLMETRTKSGNINSLLPHLTKWVNNTEFAFSLSPISIAQKYEHGTASLPNKLQAIQTLLSAGARVWLRFLPLLPVPNCPSEYKNLIQTVRESIDIQCISSIFIAPLIYNHSDYAKILQKYPNSPLYTSLHKTSDNLMKMPPSFYDEMEFIFRSWFPEKDILRDFR